MRKMTYHTDMTIQHNGNDIDVLVFGTYYPGHCGDWNNPPESDEMEIKRVVFEERDIGDDIKSETFDAIHEHCLEDARKQYDDIAYQE